MNCHQSFASRLITIGFLFILSFALMPNSVFSQTAESETQSDLLIFVEEGALTIYNNAAISISLEGFQLSISNTNGDTFTTSLQIRFDLESSNYYVPPGTCLIYRYDDDALTPSVCKEKLTQKSKVGSGDRFWYDEHGKRRVISILKNNSTTYEFCPTNLTICPISYSLLSGGLTLEPSTSPLPNRVVPENRITPPLITIPSNSGAVNVIAWSHDERILVSGHGSGDLCLWNFVRNTIDKVTCKTAHKEAVESIDWQPGENLHLASASKDGHLIIWQVVESDEGIDLEAVIENTNNYGRIQHIDWHPQEDRLLMVQADRITIMDVNFADKTLGEPYYIKANLPAVANWRRDGRFIATISEVGVAYIMDSNRVDAFQNVTLGSDLGNGLDIAWNPRFDTIVTADADNEVRLYDYIPTNVRCDNQNKTKGCPRDYDTLGLNLDAISDVEFSSNGTRLAVGLKRSIHIMEAQAPYRRIAIYDFGNSNSDTSLSSLTWNADGSKVAAGDNGGNLYIWTIQPEITERLDPVLPIQITSRSRAVGMAWDRLGTRIAVVDLDRVLTIWDVDNNKFMDSSSAHTDTPISIDWNERLNILATGGCGPMVNMWGTETKRLGPESNTIFCASSLDFRPIDDGIPVLAIADKAGTLRLFDAKNLTELRVRGWNSIFTDIEWDRNGNRIASTGENGALIVFDVDADNGYQITEAFAHETNVALNSIAWSPDNQQIATASANGWIALWSLNPEGTPAGIKSIDYLKGHSGIVKSISWSTVNGMIASVGSDDNRLILWDTKTGEIVAQQYLTEKPIEVKWSPSDSRLAVLDEAGQVTIWQFR